MTDWIVYATCFVVLLFVDFALMRGNEITLKRSLSMTAFYIASAVGFGGYIYSHHGGIDPASEYMTIYFLEKMLSVDNLLVISMIFAYFGIPKNKQHTALLYGILGAVFFRTVFVASGTWLLNQIHWIVYVFAAFLLYTGWKIVKGGDDSFNPANSTMIKFLKSKFGAGSTFIAAIIAIELSDIMFAVDSIPASFSVSQDMFIILSANLFAVLGLRSLYHAVAYGISFFSGIEKYIGAVLMFLGAEIFVKHWFDLPSWVTMSAVIATLTVGMIRCKNTDE